MSHGLAFSSGFDTPSASHTRVGLGRSFLKSSDEPKAAIPSAGSTLLDGYTGAAGVGFSSTAAKEPGSVSLFAIGCQP
jgi:hypothetical protein